MNLLFRPVGLIAGLVAGLLAKKLFDSIWKVIDGDQPPGADERDVSVARLVLVLILEGAIFALVKGLVDHGARRAFASYTGAWPGPKQQVDE
jgi:hypothetical protein